MAGLERAGGLSCGYCGVGSALGVVPKPCFETRATVWSASQRLLPEAKGSAKGSAAGQTEIG
jgi:hypothetical protein